MRQFAVLLAWIVSAVCAVAAEGQSAPTGSCGGAVSPARPIHPGCLRAISRQTDATSGVGLRRAEMLYQAALHTPAVATEVEPVEPFRCTVRQAENVRVIDLTATVSIRDSAGPDAPVVAEAAKFQSLEVVSGNAALVGEQSRRRVCAQACRGYNDALYRRDAPLAWARDRHTVASCLAQNVLWWNVRLPDGRVGWASAKYLR